MPMQICPDTFRVLEPGATKTLTGRDLLPGWMDSEIHTVAIAGARASGKSLYTAVMVKQLELLGSEFNVVVEPADESTKQRYYENYEKPLYEEMKHMQATPTSMSKNAYHADPFIFRLGKWPSKDGVLRENYLVFRDVAGEDLENQEIPRENLAFFSHADLVIFLFDPLRVNQIATYLRGIIPQQSALGGAPEDVLKNLLRIFGDRTPPLAVTISKFDTLQKLDQVSGNWQEIMGNSGAAFRRDSGWQWDENSQQLLDLEVRSLMKYMQADRIPALVENYYGSKGGTRYFAVSSLGEAPTGADLDRKGIAPYRVLDPLMWMLSSRRIMVKTKQG